jgi:hypothetical protein
MAHLPEKGFERRNSSQNTPWYGQHAIAQECDTSANGDGASVSD